MDEFIVTRRDLYGIRNGILNEIHNLLYVRGPNVVKLEDGQSRMAKYRLMRVLLADVEAELKLSEPK